MRRIPRSDGTEFQSHGALRDSHAFHTYYYNDMIVMTGQFGWSTVLQSSVVTCAVFGRFGTGSVSGWGIAAATEDELLLFNVDESGNGFIVCRVPVFRSVLRVATAPRSDGKVQANGWCFRCEWDCAWDPKLRCTPPPGVKFGIHVDVGCRSRPYGGR